jgi:hypothetical protein
MQSVERDRPNIYTLFRTGDGENSRNNTKPDFQSRYCSDFQIRQKRYCRMMFLAYAAYEVGSYVRTRCSSLIGRVIVRQAS